MIARISAIVVVAVVLTSLLLYSQNDNQPLRVSGFVEADEIRLGSRVGGRVAKVYVQEGQRVEPGETLLQLEPFDLLSRKAEAQAKLAASQADLNRLEAGFRAEEVAQARARVDQLRASLTELENGPRPQEIEAARAQLDVAQAQLELAQQSLRRTQEVFKRNAATQQELDRAIEELRAARANRVYREQQLELLTAGTRQEQIDKGRALLEEARQAWQMSQQGYRVEDIAQARAVRDAAASALETIESLIGELVIKAPAAGVIEALELQKGDLVTAGAPVLSMIDTSTMWIRAYVPLNRVALKPRQEVTVTVDGLPDESFRGTVTFISRQAEFTPSNVQTFEERAKQVARVKVTLAEGLDQIWPGMAADVWLEPRDGNQ